MNSSDNETNLVNFSPELPTLSQLDSKEGLITFPFDHIYACHSESEDRSQPLQLEKEVEISTYCVTDDKSLISATPEISKLSDQLSVAVSQNKKLKDLLIYHLDLIQQQNELITKRDKLYQALKQENDTLKATVLRIGPGGSQHHINPMPAPTSTITSSEATSGQGNTQVMLDSFSELLLPNQGSSYLFDDKDLGSKVFGIARTTPDGDIKVPTSSKKKLNTDNYKMIESKRSTNKKETKTDTRPDPQYTVTSNSGTPIIKRIQRKRRTSGIGRMSRTPRTETVTSATMSKSSIGNTGVGLDSQYGLNKKSKTVTTYSKSKTTIPKTTSQYTGSLSDRFQLIDTTPTGEDPYQMGEADLREQSPIPKLMLQKNNHGRTKVKGSTGESSGTYDVTDTKKKINRFMSVYENAKKEPEKTLMISEPDLDLVKTEPEIDWRMYDKSDPKSSLCDFSFGEGSNDFGSLLPSLDANEFQELFTSDAALNLDHLNQFDYPIEKMVPDKIKRRNNRTTSLISPTEEETVEAKRGTESRRGRKRALSATGVGKQPAKTPAKPRTPRVKAAAKVAPASPVPGLMTDKPYPTLVGDPDLSWYFGLDQELKLEDIDPPADTQASTVEVPRWREKPYTSSYTLEGTENVDDKVFEKRHQKLEAEERRQLRWHMRRIREQRHVERLRQRQRDSWCTVSPPAPYSIWPRPQQDAEFIEISNDVPVAAFGEALPQLPEKVFMLPWVRTSKAQKRSKRSKTLH